MEQAVGPPTLASMQPKAGHGWRGIATTVLYHQLLRQAVPFAKVAIESHMHTPATPMALLVTALPSWHACFVVDAAARFVVDTGIVVAACRGQSPVNKLSTHSVCLSYCLSSTLTLPVRTAQVLVTTMRPHAKPQTHPAPQRVQLLQQHMRQKHSFRQVQVLTAAIQAFRRCCSITHTSIL